MRNRKNGVAPDSYQPARPLDLIGEARRVARHLLKHLRYSKPKRLRLVFFGDIGAGKTSIALMVARAIGASSFDIERVDGPNVTLELVRKWRNDSAYSSLFGSWKVKLINELDLMPPAAQDLMLDYLDQLPPQCAILATSNLNVATLTERFQTRFQLVEVRGPSTRTLTTWLTKRWRLNKSAASFIALGSCGNVRAALLDSSNYLTFGTLAKRPKAPTDNDWKALRAASLRNKRRNGTHTA